MGHHQFPNNKIVEDKKQRINHVVHVLEYIKHGSQCDVFLMQCSNVRIGCRINFYPSVTMLVSYVYATYYLSQVYSGYIFQ